MHGRISISIKEICKQAMAMSISGYNLTKQRLNNP